MMSSAPIAPEFDAARPVGILGYGHFGRALAELARGAGLPLRVFDPGAAVPEDVRAGSPADLAAGAGIIVPAVPIPALREAVGALRPHLTRAHLVLDVASVKAPAVEVLTGLLGDAVPWIPTHPLFGPASLARGERPLRVVVCPHALHPGAQAPARAFYEHLGCLVAEQEATEHDRQMARTHALAFFVAKAMLDIAPVDADDPARDFIPPSFGAMARTIETVRADAGHLFAHIQNTNPFAADARQELMDAMGRIHTQLLARAARPEAGERSLDIAPLEPEKSVDPPPSFRE